MPPAAESIGSNSGGSNATPRHHQHGHQLRDALGNPIASTAAVAVSTQPPSSQAAVSVGGAFSHTSIATTDKRSSAGGTIYSSFRKEGRHRRKSRSTSFRLPFVHKINSNNRHDDEEDKYYLRDVDYDDDNNINKNGADEEHSISEMSDMTLDESAAIMAAASQYGRRRRSSGSSRRTAASLTYSLNQAVDHSREAMTPSRRSSMTVLDSLTINKLNFDRAGLHGREEATRQLQSIWYGVYERHIHHKEEQERVSKDEKEDKEVAKPVAIVNNKVLTIVKGQSGVGKTQVITTVLKKQVERSHGFFISGKFDLQQFDKPFNGIIMAMDDLCDKILAGPVAGSGSFRLREGCAALEPLDYTELKNHLLERLRLELPFLCTIFPKLHSIVGSDFSVAGTEPLDESSAFSRTGQSLAASLDSVDGGRDTIDFKANAAEQLKHCVRKLIQVISSACPLAIHLDDTHWADQESMDLLYQILTDYSNRDALMVVCSYRSNEVNEEHKMIKFLKDVKAISKNNPVWSVPIHSLTIEDFSVQDVDAFLQDLLVRDTSDTMKLAQVVFDKTQGNIFYIIQVLEFLHRKGLLAYNLGLFKWVWDADEIRDNAPPGDNVVDLLKDKLIQDDEANQLLPIAALLGSHFSRRILVTVVEGFRKRLQNSNLRSENADALYDFLSLDFDVNELLKQCHREGYIQATPAKDGYQFIHDRIQEAALAIWPNAAFYLLKHEVGRILATTLPEVELESMVFIVIGLLNEGQSSTPLDPEENLCLLRLNLLAGHKAMTFAAFKPASKYFNAAIKLLPACSWQSHHELTLDLYSTAAVAQFSVADFAATKSFCDKILKEQTVACADKLTVSHVLIDTEVAQHTPGESMGTVISLLNECGIKLPRHDCMLGLCAGFGLLRTKLSKKMQDPKTVASLGISSKKVDASIMKTLDHLATAAYVGKPEFFPAVVLKSIRYTFENGITVYSPAAFALVGLLLSCFMDDFAAGWSYASNALAMLKRLKCKEVESRTIFVSYTYSAQWIKPMQDCMKHLLKGYKIGLSTGDVQSSMYCAHFWCEYALYTGMPLALVDSNMKTYGDQMEDFGQKSILAGLKMVHQAVRILRGKAGHNDGTGAVLSGDIMDQEEVLEKFSAAGAEFMTLALQRYRPILACYMGDHAHGASLAIKWTDKCCKALPGQPVTVVVRFCSALSCYDMARKTKKKRYLKEAKRQHKFLRRWSERPKGKLNPNCVHREVLLSAELDAVQGKFASALKKFEKAVLLAGRRGIIQDQALANERWAALCLEQGAHEDYYFRLNFAIRLYEEWGASAKVDALKLSLNPKHRGGPPRASSSSLLQQDISSIRSLVPMKGPLDEDRLREIEQEASIRGFTMPSGSAPPLA